MKRLVLSILLVLLLPTPAFAVNRYINSSCISACDGTTMTKGWATFGAATWTTGYTYYVAGGTYTENVTISASCTIKKYNSSDNGSESDWNSTLATTQAVISGKLVISADNVSILGVTGSGTSGYGIKIAPTSLSVDVVTVSNQDTSHLDHIEIAGPDRNGGSGNGVYWNNSLAQKGLWISNCWIHDVSDCGVKLGNAVGTSYSDYGFLFENNWLTEIGSTSIDMQGIQLSWVSADAYTIMRGNTFRNIRSTSHISFLGGGSTHTQSRIYNNLFYESVTQDAMMYAIFSDSTSGTTVSYIYIYNNTFYNITGTNKHGRIWFSGTVSNVTVRNNLRVTCQLTGDVGVSTSSNNGYYNDNGAGNPGDTESADPFYDSPTYDFHLKSTANSRTGGYTGATDLGCTSGVTCVDKDGVIRPQGATWSIGAYEYTAGVTSVPGLKGGRISGGSIK